MLTLTAFCAAPLTPLYSLPACNAVSSCEVITYVVPLSEVTPLNIKLGAPSKTGVTTDSAAVFALI